MFEMVPLEMFAVCSRNVLFASLVLEVDSIYAVDNEVKLRRNLWRFFEVFKNAVFRFEWKRAIFDCTSLESMQTRARSLKNSSQLNIAI